MDLLGQMSLLEHINIAPMVGCSLMHCLLREYFLKLVVASFHWLISRVRIFQAEAAQLLQELPIPNVVDLKFSPRGTYLSTWERPGIPSPIFFI